MLPRHPSDLTTPQELKRGANPQDDYRGGGGVKAVMPWTEGSSTSQM